MSISLKHRSFLKLTDFSPKEIKYLLDLSFELKSASVNEKEKMLLKGKNIALLFEKPSTRTRCAFEIAVFNQGGNVSFIERDSSQFRTNESIKDTARVLGRMYDGIAYSGFSQETLTVLAKYAGVPVWNGLTDESHPTQVIADLMTMVEHCDKPLRKMSLCYIGNARNKIASSLMVGAVKMGIDFRIAAPENYQPVNELINQCIKIGKETGGKVTISSEIEPTTKGVDFLYTDAWASMNEPFSVWEERIHLLQPYQVNQHLINLTGNPKLRFLHCLPAFHNRETETGQLIFEKFNMECLEVSDEVFESPASIVFDQTENRIHSIKAVLVATLA